MATDVAILRSAALIVHLRCLYLEMSTPVVSVFFILLFRSTKSSAIAVPTSILPLLGHPFLIVCAWRSYSVSHPL